MCSNGVLNILVRKPKPNEVPQLTMRRFNSQKHQVIIMHVFSNRRQASKRSRRCRLRYRAGFTSTGMECNGAISGERISSSATILEAGSAQATSPKQRPDQ
jgi:predicted nucleotidyltransferase